MLNRRDFGTLMAAGAALASAGGAAAKTAGGLRIETIASAHLPEQVNVAIYTPPGYREGQARALPLALMLHGGNGSERDLLRFTDRIDREIGSGRLPPMIIATPAAGRSLYMDFRDGSQRWETFILDTLLPHLRRSLAVSDKRSGTYIGGWSMGGLGALRIAFKHPELFAAVAALEPAIEPALFWDEIGPSVRFWRPEEVLRPMFGDPIDKRYWEANNPATIASRDPARLLDLSIYVEVGDQDMLHLYEGAEFLHRILFDARIAHEYRMVHGAEHVGPSTEPRLIDALGFLGRQIDPPDWVNADVLKARAVIDDQKRAIGFPIEAVDPRRLKAS